jgi:ribosomal protein L7/L12
MGNTCNGSGGEGRPIFAVLKRRQDSIEVSVADVVAVTVPYHIECAVKKLIQHEEKVEAIRLVRGACDLGLKDAKDIVDHFTAVIHGCENYEAYLRATVR